MLELPRVTLVCIDCVRHELALAAIEQSMMRCRFAEVLFVTDREIPIEALRVMKVAPILTHADYSRFVAKDLASLIRTSHALIIQWDAFVVNPAAWTGEFLDFDHVRPARLSGVHGEEEAPAVGGIALVSRQMLEALRDPRIADVADEDRAMRQTYRPLLEGEFGLRYAPQAIAERFAFGTGYPVGQPFGFQGLFNMWMFFQPQDLNALLAMATPAILGSTAALSLGVNLRDLGRSDEAIAVLRAILGAHPGHAVARSLLEAMQRPAIGAAPAVQLPRTAVGRNDPCPCGSGQKFKQCHGRLGAAPAPLPPSVPAPASAAVPAAAAAPVAGDAFVADGALAVLFHRARAAFDRHDPAAAEGLYRKVLERLPRDPVAIEFLGVIATTQRRFHEAEPLLRQAIDIAPGAPENHNNLGLLHQARVEFAAAAAAYRQALELAPDYGPAHNNLGLAQQELGRVADAIASFRAAIRCLPAFAEAHWNLALALLLGGDLAEGLAEHEWRLRVEQHRAWWARRQQFPAWHGEPLAGKRLLILAEQGMGDMIQFVRYAEVLAARGATVLVEAPADLADLFRAAPGVSAVVPRDGPYPPCDYQAPVMSLPLLCGTVLETIPARTHYLAADPMRAARWRERLETRTRPRVGLAWAGNPDHVRDTFRSMPLAALMPLLAIPEIEWIGLQKGAPAQQIAALPAGCVLRDMAAHSQNFADLAALISELDLVITVDTSVVHLAGALGRPTLLLLDTAHDWRWLQHRHDSPWYPTVRLIRQSTRSDWAGAVEEAKIELARHFNFQPSGAGTAVPQ